MEADDGELRVASASPKSKRSDSASRSPTTVTRGGKSSGKGKKKIKTPIKKAREGSPSLLVDSSGDDGASGRRPEGKLDDILHDSAGTRSVLNFDTSPNPHESAGHDPVLNSTHPPTRVEMSPPTMGLNIVLKPQVTFSVTREVGLVLLLRLSMRGRCLVSSP